MSDKNWYVDYVEEELDGAEKAEFEMLLKNSNIDREIVNNIENVKAQLEVQDEIEQIEFKALDDKFFEDMHDTIMARVEQAKVEPKPLLQVRTHHKQAARRFGTIFAVASLTLVAVLVMVGQGRNHGAIYQDPVVSEALQSPESFADSTIGYQSQADFFVDVAGEKVDDLKIN